jgi:trk system potassium uptake protein TrkA
VTREALLLDDGTDFTLYLVKLFLGNGYVVRVLAPEGRAELFAREPAYIHTYGGNPREALEGLDFSRVEIAVFASRDDRLNLQLAREARSRAVPLVIIAAMDSSVARAAEEEGVVVMPLYQCVASMLVNTLNLRFARMLPVRGAVAVLDALVTSDSKLLGSSIREIEEGLGVRALIIRGDSLITSRDAEVQEGDCLIAVGPRSALERIIE